jgi:hypothetical protein
MEVWEWLRCGVVRCGSNDQIFRYSHTPILNHSHTPTLNHFLSAVPL